MSTKEIKEQPFPSGNLRNWNLVAFILEMDKKIKFCCSGFRDSCCQYQALKMHKDFPACLDDLRCPELKPIFMLLESFLEKKCMWCGIPPHYLTTKEKALLKGKKT